LFTGNFVHEIFATFISQMKRNLLFLLCLLYVCIATGQSDSLQKIIEGRRNSIEQQQKSYVILISADGFRYDYPEKHEAKTLMALGNEGVRAEGMIPSYPSLTFPNHYTIVTGLYPSHHGLVNNYFYDATRHESYSMRDSKTVTDGSWYGETPLWVLAEQQQMLTASYYWVGSEADVQKTRPTYYYRFNDTVSMDHRIQEVVNWLQLPTEKRPHFITFYISNADHQGHTYGPDAPQTAAAVHFIDSSIQKLTDAVKKTGLAVNYIFLADHGMTNVDVDHPLMMPVFDTAKFVIPRGAELVELYAKNENDISETYHKLKKQEHGFKVYLKNEMPAYLHYGEKDDVMNRVGDILLIPAWPLTFTWGSSRKPSPGAHGYDPYLVKDMRAVFIAWGPAFKNHVQIPAFENVNVFPVITKILGLTYGEKIDGDAKIANQILK
jgi:predicted AlkP superfamily pyrophosphatase or phosphodiesterase